MKIKHALNVFAAAMLLMALGSVSVAVWAARQSDFHSERIALAYSSYQSHLQLTADTYLLFKRFGDFLLVGSKAEVDDADKLEKRLRGHLKNIRTIIEAEIELVGDEELEELELLDDLEAKVEDLISQYNLALRRIGTDDGRSDWRQLSLLLNDNLKQDFNELITVALEEEQEEVAETEADASFQMESVRIISYTLAVIFVIMTVCAFFVFHRIFSQPFNTLMLGVRGFAEGDFSSTIKLRGRNELSETAQVLNKMSKVVAERTTFLTEQNEILEEAVQERTEKLQSLLKEARKSEQNRRQLLADVSHELRTPLTVIQGESDIALRGQDKTADEYKEALQRARAAANHTSTLVKDLLFIAQNEAGTLKLNREKVDLIKLLNDVIEISGLEVEVDCQTKDSIAFADHTRLRQAVLAILENAKNHGGHSVKIALNTCDGAFFIAITDDGPGIPDTEKDSVFERFFRGSNAANRYTDGLGLGLPIVRSIARAHGGDVRITDAKPTGATFTLELPKTQINEAAS
mgnify:CR=1 FL=1